MGRITIKAKMALRALKEAKVKNTLYLEDFIKSETAEGPKATPMKRIQLGPVILCEFRLIYSEYLLHSFE